MRIVSLKVIASDLHGSTLASFWANTAFLLANVVSLPLYMALANILGRTLPLKLSFVFFVAGSILFATARNMLVLIMGRLLQGLDAGGLDVLPEMIVADITPLKTRPLYVGLLGLPMAMGSALGPILSALLAESNNWRWIGWINLPLSVIAFGLVLTLQKRKIRNAVILLRLKSADWLGMLLLTVGLTLFVLPLSWADSLFPWESWETILPLAVGIALLISLGFYEMQPLTPIFPHRLFQPLTAKTSLAAVLMHGIVVYCLMIYVPLYFQSVRLETPTQTAVSMLPLTLSVVSFGCIAGVAVERLGRYAWIIRLGAVLMSCGVWLLSLLDRSTSLAVQSIYELIAGVGLGTLYTILTIPMQASVLYIEDTGIAAGMVAFARLLGGSTGLAISSTVFSSTFKVSLDLPSDSGVPAELRNGSGAVSFIPALRDSNLPAHALDQIIISYRKSFQTVWWTMTGFSAVALLASWWIKDFPLDETVRQTQNS